MTRVSEVIVVDGVAKSRTQWCEYYGITTSTLSKRLLRDGITIEDAIRMGGRKLSAVARARAAKAAIPLPDLPLRMCANASNCYVTEDGRVWNDTSKRWMKISTWATDPDSPHKSYARVSIEGTVRYVQTVVAEAWLDNPDNLPWVLHKDDNTLNNHKDNLAWSTQKGIFAHKKELKEGK